MEANKVFGQGKGQEADKLNIDSIIARLLEGKNYEIGLNRKLIDLELNFQQSDRISRRQF